MSDRRDTFRALTVGTLIPLALAAFVVIGEQEGQQAGSPGSSFTQAQEAPREILRPTGTPAWETVATKVSPSVVSLQVTAPNGERSLGSGVILSREGHIVTNSHVVRGASSGAVVSATLSDGSIYRAALVQADPQADLALVKLVDPPSTLKPIAVGKSSATRVGDPVMAIGNPLGLSGTVTVGIVSSTHRAVTTSPEERYSSRGQRRAAGGQDSIVNALQTDAAINQGNSGGALVNAQGQLIGINSSIATAEGSTGSIGIGFAIPSDHMAQVVEEFLRGRPFTYGTLKISVQAGAGQVGGAQRVGAVVASVTPGGPGARGGLQKGDVIVSADGQAVTSSVSLVASVREHRAGEVLRLEILRGGKLTALAVTLGEVSSSPQA